MISNNLSRRTTSWASANCTAIPLIPIYILYRQVAVIFDPVCMHTQLSLPSWPLLAHLVHYTWPIPTSSCQGLSDPSPLLFRNMLFVYTGRSLIALHLFPFHGGRSYLVIIYIAFLHLFHAFMRIHYVHYVGLGLKHNILECCGIMWR